MSVGWWLALMSGPSKRAYRLAKAGEADVGAAAFSPTSAERFHEVCLMDRLLTLLPRKPRKGPKTDAQHDARRATAHSSSRAPSHGRAFSRVTRTGSGCR